MGRPRAEITEDQFLAALARNGNRRRDTANELHCSERRIDSFCDRHGIARPPKRPKSCSNYKPKVVWNVENVSRLRTLYLDDLVSIEKVAVEFNSTPASILPAISRAGFSRVAYRKALHPQYQKPASVQKERKCLCCRMPFASEGSHNRQCQRCFSANSEMAA
jgi:hypothetical protein